jgi:DNA-binding transcriptional ArsR family regulator
VNSDTLSALAEPNRLRIVELLREHPYPVGEIARKLTMRQPQVSKHLQVLSAAGIVRVRPIAQQRVYQLQPRPFREIDSWLETFQRVWEKRLDSMEELLEEMKLSEKRGKRK